MLSWNKSITIRDASNRVQNISHPYMWDKYSEHGFGGGYYILYSVPCFILCKINYSSVQWCLNLTHKIEQASETPGLISVA